MTKNKNRCVYRRLGPARLYQGLSKGWASQYDSQKKIIVEYNHHSFVTLWLEDYFALSTLSLANSPMTVGKDEGSVEKHMLLFYKVWVHRSTRAREEHCLSLTSLTCLHALTSSLYILLFPAMSWLGWKSAGVSSSQTHNHTLLSYLEIL